MILDRVVKIAAWLYIAALIAVAFAHLNIQAEIGNPFNVYRVLALGLAGMLARIAYPAAPSGAFLMVIGGVGGLGLAHFVENGNFGYPMDIIADMAAGLWGVALGAVMGRIRTSSASRRSLLH
jgi:hypothetical protein